MQEVRSPALYNAVISAIASGETKVSSIANAVNMPTPATVQYLKSLIELGIVEKSMPVLMANKKQGVYRVADSLFRFWYRFVPKYAAALELGLSKETARAIVEESMSTFLGPVFEEACRQWLMREIGKRDLTILPTGIGSWWGNDPVRKQQAEIDIVITGAEGELIIGECKWREKETDADVIDTLVHRSGLLPGSDKKLYVFSKAPFTEACRESAERHRAILVQANEMIGS